MIDAGLFDNDQDLFDMQLPEGEKLVPQDPSASVQEEKKTEEVLAQPESSFNLNTQQRSGDKLRKNLLSKLTYEKIWLTPQQKPKHYETAIIFDWDDTLLCTSYINPGGVYRDVELSSQVLQHIKLLEITTKK